MLTRLRVFIGQFEDIDGIDCYVATPSFDYPKDQLVLVLTNVFGAKYIKNQVCKIQPEHIPSRLLILFVLIHSS